MLQATDAVCRIDKDPDPETRQWVRRHITKEAATYFGYPPIRPRQRVILKEMW